jgi:cytochrome c peroxidase
MAKQEAKPLNPGAFDLCTLTFVIILSVGCQPAVHYDKPEPTPAPTKPTVETPKAVEHDIVWMNPRPQEIQPDAPIEFVHETDGPEWAKLTKLWNPPLTEKESAAARAAAALTLPPGAAAMLAEPRAVVKVKVAAGLDDPRPFIPASNPPTLHKWELGRRLFYDKKWLTDGGESCATCHDSHTGFADNARDHYGLNTPTLVNCVYNGRQFWDGRAGVLEEVVQRTMDDETAPAKGTAFRHVWSGAVGRLRARRFEYEHRFLSAFGTLPTQDAVGKALATYMRTLLAGDSVHDRALAAQVADHSPELKAEHYEKALDAAAWKDLKIDEKDKTDAARKIYRGYRLFHDLEERKTGCIHCHGGREFTDGRFHNLGVGFNKFDPGEEPGRFASLPVGEKEGRLIGAYKTPTLRGLSRTAPYFHDGSAATLEEAVQFHTDGGQRNEYLDPELQKRDLPALEREALILFLRALNGKDVDLPPPE